MTSQIDINVADVASNVSVGTEVGDSLGSGFGLSGGGLRMGGSAVDFCSVMSQGERIVIVVDIAKSMLDPERDGIPDFMRVKREV